MAESVAAPAIDAAIDAAIEPVASVLRQSLGHLASEVPDSYRHLVGELGGLVVEVTTDGEVFVLRTHGGQLEVVDGAGAAPAVAITTTRATILDVLNGEIALADTVQSGRLDVRGSLDDVLHAHDTLVAYAHAAVRAPSVPGLIDALRGDPDGVW